MFVSTERENGEEKGERERTKALSSSTTYTIKGTIAKNMEDFLLASWAFFCCVVERSEKGVLGT